MVAAMASTTELTGRFRALHVPGRPLLMPNAWDPGSAKILASLGFESVATTSSGHAATLGRPDGSVIRHEALTHARDVAAAVPVPVTADLEDGFGTTPDEVAETVRLAAGTGLAGCSIEDWCTADGALLDPTLARDRIAAAVEAANGRLVLTARAENHIRGVDDVADTISRLQSFQEAGADVLYAPGVTSLEDVAAVVSSVDRPVNVLALPTAPPVAALAEAGVARVSVGGAFAYAAFAALVDAAEELRDSGTYGFWQAAGRGGVAAKAAFRA